MAIIWPYPSTPSSYVSAGQQVVVPPQRCPTCLRVNWSAGWVLALAASAAVPRTDLDAPWSVYGRVSVITKSVRTCGARVSSHSNWGMLLAQPRGHLLLIALLLMITGWRGAPTEANQPIQDSWMPLSTSGNPGARREHIAVWTGSQMLVVGGTSCGGRCGPGPFPPPGWQAGGRYDPATDSWQPMQPPPQLGTDAVIWDGSKMLTFGQGGQAYDPVRDSWRTLSNQGAPTPRSQGVVVWTGDAMLVWGGSTADGVVGDEARYDPSNDSWTPISSAGAPSSRHSATGV